MEIPSLNTVLVGATILSGIAAIIYLAEKLFPRPPDDKDKPQKP